MTKRHDSFVWGNKYVNHHKQRSCDFRRLGRHTTSMMLLFSFFLHFYWSVTGCVPIHCHGKQLLSFSFYVFKQKKESHMCILAQIHLSLGCQHRQVLILENHEHELTADTTQMALNTGSLAMKKNRVCVCNFDFVRVIPVMVYFFSERHFFKMLYVKSFCYNKQNQSRTALFFFFLWTHCGHESAYK